MDPKTHSCAGGEFAELAGREEHPSTEARKKIGHALSTVFQVAAIGSAVGVLLAFYTFSDMRTEKPD